MRNQNGTEGLCRTKYTLNKKAYSETHSINNENQANSNKTNNTQDYKVLNIYGNTDKLKDSKIYSNYGRKGSNSSSHNHICDGNLYCNPFDENLLCADCINKYLMDQKNKRDIEDNEYNNININPPYLDKYKEYNQKIINDKIKNREDNINNIKDKFKDQYMQSKNNYIDKLENCDNFMNSVNTNYLYEKAKKNQELNQKIIDKNKHKFISEERPEIQSYYDHYINNNYKSYFDRDINEKRKQNMENYKNDLLKQIAYKNKKMLQEKENDEKLEKEQYALQLEKANEEYMQKLKKQEELKNDVINCNNRLIRDKLRKIKKEEDETFNNDQENIKYMNQLNEIEKQKEEERKLNQKKIIQDSYNLYTQEKLKKLKKLENENNIPYDNCFAHSEDEEMGVCVKCRRIFPRRLLTKNMFFYKYNGR